MNRLHISATRVKLAAAALLALLGAVHAQAQVPMPMPGRATQPTAAAAKVLLVISSEGRNDANDHPGRPGFKMDEFALAWLALRANGLHVEVASPSGGAVVAERHQPQDDPIQAMKTDAQTTAALAITRRTQDVEAGEHAAIFIVGGKGAMFDLPRDGALTRLPGAHHAQGGTLAAEAVVRALGRTPVARTLLHEDASMQVVPWWLAGEQAAARALLAANPALYKTELIAMLDFHPHGAATDDAARRQAISVMELAAPHFSNPRLSVRAGPGPGASRQHGAGARAAATRAGRQAGRCRSHQGLGRPGRLRRRARRSTNLLRTPPVLIT